MLFRSAVGLHDHRDLHSFPTRRSSDLPSPKVSWVDEHLLVVVGGSRRNQVEPDGPGSRTSKDQALQISTGRAGQAPNRRPGGRAQITP